MDVSAPYRAIGASTETEVLVELARVTKPRSGREIAGRIDRTHPAVNRALGRLVEQGIVLRDAHPRVSYYTLNQQHLLAGVVREMADARNDLLRRLKSAIEDWAIPAFHASLVGSAARSDGNVSSDIDLLIVRPGAVEDDGAWQAQIEALTVSVTAWTGNHVQVIAFGQEQFEDELTAGHETLKNMSADAVLLHGQRMSMLARRLRRR